MSPEEREKIRVRLGISEKQQNQLEQSFFETMDKRGELGKRLRQLFEAREKLYETYEIDRAKERSIRNEIANIQNQFLVLHLESEEKVRRILNREQFARFQEWREEHKGQWRDRAKRWKEKGTPSP
jgi:Spy/CpxP family protein refolding chaperone